MSSAQLPVLPVLVLILTEKVKKKKKFLSNDQNGLQ